MFAVYSPRGERYHCLRSRFIDRIGPPLQSFSSSFACFGLLIHHDAPFLFVSAKDESALGHHLADQLVDRRKYFDRFPDELLQPKFVQDAFETRYEIFHLRILLKTSCRRSV